MTRGWIKLHRKIIASDIYQMPPLYLRVFERLLLEANHEDKEIPFAGSTLLVRRGERVTSLRQIAEWVGWFERGIFRTPNPKTIRSILEWLESNSMIKLLSNSKATHYRVLNYCVYQDDDTAESNSKATGKSNSKVTVKQQSLDTNKNDKKEIHSGTNVPEASPVAGSSLDDVPNNGQLIAELVGEYRRAIPDKKHRRGDFPFVGKLYNDYGYDEVLVAIRDLAYKRDTGFMPEEPLIFLRAMLGHGGVITRTERAERRKAGERYGRATATAADYSIEAIIAGAGGGQQRDYLRL